MNTAVMLAFLASLIPGSDAPLPTTPSKPPKVDLKPKKQGTLRVEFSKARKTMLVGVTSQLTRISNGELVPSVEIEGVGGRVTTRRLGAAQDQVHDRTTSIELEVRLNSSMTPTNAARLEAQLDRCVTLALGAPTRSFHAMLVLTPEAFEKALADIAAADQPPLRLVIEPDGIKEFVCRN